MCAQQVQKLLDLVGKHYITGLKSFSQTFLLLSLRQFVKSCGWIPFRSGCEVYSTVLIYRFNGVFRVSPPSECSLADADSCLFASWKNDSGNFNAK